MTLPISIIIPTFNEDKYLPRLLRSISKQTNAPQEIIIADANSKDKTIDIAKKYNCIIVKGGKPSVGRNNGAKIATQEILLFLDADVILPEKFLEDTYHEMKHRKLDIASCYALPQTKKASDQVIIALWNNYFSLTEMIYPHACGFCIFIKRDLHKKIRGFSKDIAIAEDVNYIQKASKKGKFRFLKSQKIYISTRRFIKGGTLKTTLKYIAIELHQVFLGDIKKDIYKYDFGDYSKKTNINSKQSNKS